MPKTRTHFLLLLLTLLTLLWLAGDRMKPNGHIDHNDPVNNLRMGIFHYNEGNKSLKTGNLEEAISNYKMALHHNPNSAETLINLSSAYLRNKQYDEAFNTLKILEGKTPSNPLLFYNFACYYSLTNQTGPGLAALKQAVNLGYKNFKEVREDPDLENLRKAPEFAEWIKKAD